MYLQQCVSSKFDEDSDNTQIKAISESFEIDSLPGEERSIDGSELKSLSSWSAFLDCSSELRKLSFKSLT